MGWDKEKRERIRMRGMGSRIRITLTTVLSEAAAGASGSKDSGKVSWMREGRIDKKGVKTHLTSKRSRTQTLMMTNEITCFVSLKFFLMPSFREFQTVLWC